MAVTVIGKVAYANDGTGGGPAGGTATGSGNVILVAGTVTVNDPSIQATSRISLSTIIPGSNLGHVYVRSGSIVAGVHFIIDSTDGSDTSTISYLVIN